MFCCKIEDVEGIVFEVDKFVKLVKWVKYFVFEGFEMFFEFVLCIIYEGLINFEVQVYNLVKFVNDIFVIDKEIGELKFDDNGELVMKFGNGFFFIVYIDN